jgi:hypothetical protein
MNEKIVGVVRDISQFLVGSVVSDTEETIVLKNVALLGISGEGNQTNIQFIPLDILSLKPPFGIRNLVKNQSVSLDVPFKKSDLLFYVEDLADVVVSNYKNFTVNAFPGIPQLGQEPQTANSEQTIVKLFDDK